MNFEVRKSKLSDLGPALQLDKEAFGVDSWTVLDYAGVFSIRDVKKFTAVAEGKFAGFAASEFDAERGAVCLLTLAVRPEYREMGIGTALLRHCEEAFPVRRYYLNVDVENRTAIRLYEKSGYSRTGIEQAYYLNGHDALIMEKPAENNSRTKSPV